jgi:glutamyl-tRNA reductase
VSRLTLLGLNHRSPAALAARERLAIVPKTAVFAALKDEGVSEAVVLSTCNRFEIYLCDERPRPESWAHDFLEKLAGAPVEDQAYHMEDAAAVEHLFQVASGLDSLVVGESEILSQVKAAYETAREAGMTGKRTNVLFQRALFTGKKARTDTGIGVGQTSVASVAVQLAETIFGTLSASEVLILGAGQMAELTARHMLSKKVAKLTIANRTWERGKALADSLKAAALAWEHFESALQSVDIVICSTGADKPILSRAAVEAAAAKRAGRSLFIIDIAMPRDVDEGVHGLEHVYVYRLSDLEEIANGNLKSRAVEVEKARALARQKAAEFGGWLDSLKAGQEISLKHSEAANS